MYLEDKLNPGERERMTDEDYAFYRRALIKGRLRQLSDDIVQAAAGESVPGIEDRKAEFVALHNELRALEGKEPRNMEV